MRPLHCIDYSVIDAYLLVSLGIGLELSRRAGKNSESYFLGSRSVPWWINGVSLVGAFAACRWFRQEAAPLSH